MIKKFLTYLISRPMTAGGEFAKRNNIHSELMGGGVEDIFEKEQNI